MRNLKLIAITLNATKKWCTHNQAKHINMNNQYEIMQGTIKRERVRANGSSANNKICFEVWAPSSTSPPSPRRISNPLACPQRTPRKGTSTEDLGQYNHKQYLTPLLTNTTSSLRHNSKPTINHLTTWGISTKLTYTRITSQLEGYNPNAQHQMHNLLSTMRARHKARNEFTTWWSNNNHKQFLSPTMIL